MEAKNTVTRESLAVTVFAKTAVAIADAIHALGGVASGTLYAQLMNYVPMDVYLSILDTLVKGNYIRIKDHWIMWIGPHTPVGDECSECVSVVGSLLKDSIREGGA